KVVWIEKAEDEVGVRHRRLDASVAVTGRTRLRTGALGYDVQHAAEVDARDGAPAGADGGDVQALQRHPLAGNAPIRSNRRLPAYHQRDVGRGAAHVEGNEIAVGEERGSVRTAGNAAGRAGKHAASRQPHGFGN